MLLLLTSVLVFLGLLVLQPAEIGDATDRRDGGWGDLDEVQALLTRERQRVLRRHDAELSSFIVDDAHLANPDLVVDSKRSRYWGGLLPGKKKSWGSRSVTTIVEHAGARFV